MVRYLLLQQLSNPEQKQQDTTPQVQYRATLPTPSPALFDAQLVLPQYHISIDVVVLGAFQRSSNF